MWIRVIKPLPLKHAPPVFSVHYAKRVSLGDEQRMEILKDILFCTKGYYAEYAEDWVKENPVEAEALLQSTREYHDNFGLRPNEVFSVWITWLDQPIKLLAHEYIELSHNNLIEAFFNPYDEDEFSSYHLVPNITSSVHMLAVAQEVNLQAIRDAAILDGANSQAAAMTAMGIPIYEFVDKDVDLTTPQPHIPDIGALIVHPLLANLLGHADHPVYDNAWDEDGEYVGWEGAIASVERQFAELKSETN